MATSPYKLINSSGTMKLYLHPRYRQSAYLSMALGNDRSRLISRSMLFCFLINCIFLALSANESDLRITKSSGASFDNGGMGGRLTVTDSSMSNVVVCRRRGSNTFTSILLSVWRIGGFSSRSGVEVHDDGRFVGPT